ncbi:MAG: DsbA family protein [Gammaproteobacteria bacterium]|nr:DsbA family protein [Gammaproteobacteria bacterium]
MEQPTLYYFYDPMCSWCWGFSPAWNQLQSAVMNETNVVTVLGGLAPDSNEPMPIQMQEYLQQTWRMIALRIPGTVFNHDFWTQCQPRRSTYPACRAVIAARLQGKGFENMMITAIQEGYYLQGKNPSDDSTLVDLAVSVGLKGNQFEEDLNTVLTQETLDREIAFGHSVGIQGFPSLVLMQNGKIQVIPVNFTDADSMISSVRMGLNAG